MPIGQVVSHHEVLRNARRRRGESDSDRAMAIYRVEIAEFGGIVQGLHKIIEEVRVAAQVFISVEPENGVLDVSRNFRDALLVTLDFLNRMQTEADCIVPPIRMKNLTTMVMRENLGTNKKKSRNKVSTVDTKKSAGEAMSDLFTVLRDAQRRDGFPARFLDAGESYMRFFFSRPEHERNHYSIELLHHGIMHTILYLEKVKQVISLSRRDLKSLSAEVAPLAASPAPSEVASSAPKSSAEIMSAKYAGRHGIRKSRQAGEPDIDEYSDGDEEVPDPAETVDNRGIVACPEFVNNPYEDVEFVNKYVSSRL